jgi:hypothetical protein
VESDEHASQPEPSKRIRVRVTVTEHGLLARAAERVDTLASDALAHALRDAGFAAEKTRGNPADLWVHGGVAAACRVDLLPAFGVLAGGGSVIALKVGVRVADQALDELVDAVVRFVRRRRKGDGQRSYDVVLYGPDNQPLREVRVKARAKRKS